MIAPLLSTPWIVFDVESVGLHGEAFAFGYVVVVGGLRVEEGLFCCDPSLARGRPTDRQWVAENVNLEATPRTKCPSPGNVREEFWSLWQSWRAKGAVLVAETPWPVEARLLVSCVDDDTPTRDWEGPYPLVDVTSICSALGFPTSAKRIPEELPAHNPLCDARHSARLLRQALESTPGRASSVEALRLMREHLDDPDSGWASSELLILLERLAGETP